MPLHISIDTETWGKRAGCDGRSIGACTLDYRQIFGDSIPKEHSFTSQAGAGAGLFYVAVENRLTGTYSSDHYTQRELDSLDGSLRRYTLHRDPDTVNWWYDKTTDDAKAAFNNPVDLKEGLILLTKWLEELGVDPKDPDSVRLYGHGGGYDLPILEAWFHACGLPVPWHYRSGRDTRSIFDMVDIDDHSDWIHRHRFGTFHSSRDDSLSQATAIVEALKLKGQRGKTLLYNFPGNNDKVQGIVTLEIHGNWDFSTREMLDWVEMKLSTSIPEGWGTGRGAINYAKGVVVSVKTHIPECR
jgi:hypothetical protein